MALFAQQSFVADAPAPCWAHLPMRRRPVSRTVRHQRTQQGRHMQPHCKRQWRCRANDTSDAAPASDTPAEPPVSDRAAHKAGPSFSTGGPRFERYDRVLGPPDYGALTSAGITELALHPQLTYGQLAILRPQFRPHDASWTFEDCKFCLAPGWPAKACTFEHNRCELVRTSARSLLGSRDARCTRRRSLSDSHLPLHQICSLPVCLLDPQAHCCTLQQSRSLHFVTTSSSTSPVQQHSAQDLPRLFKEL